MDAHHKKNADDITALKKAIAEIKEQRSKHDAKQELIYELAD